MSEINSFGEGSCWNEQDQRCKNYLDSHEFFERELSKVRKIEIDCDRVFYPKESPWYNLEICFLYPIFFTGFACHWGTFSEGYNFTFDDIDWG